MARNSTTWRTYEEVARHLLGALGQELGLERVEGKQALPGRSGTTWEIDGKGVKADTGAVIVIECRRYINSRLKQEAMAALAYRIGDVGAAGGIVVTPLGLQEGAEIVAAYEGIELVHLNAEATHTDFVLQFLERVTIGVSAQASGTGTMTAKVQVGPTDPTAD